MPSLCLRTDATASDHDTDDCALRSRPEGAVPLDAAGRLVSTASAHPTRRAGVIAMPRTQQSRRAGRDDRIARMIRKPNRATLTVDVALLLSSGMRLLVRHASSPAGRGGLLVRPG